MAKSKSTASLELVADGIKFVLWAETDGDVHIKIDDNEEVICSSSTACIIGMGLMQLSEPEDDA